LITGNGTPKKNLRLGRQALAEGSFTLSARR
jgi:hypothetical protein